MDATTTSGNSLRTGILDLIRTARFSDGLRCVRCHSTCVTRWGWFSGRRRYRCGACRRTFSDLTGTPAAYTKKLVLWGSFSECVELSLSVRRIAALLGIHPSTAFRWRHALMAEMWEQDDVTLSGPIELGDIWFAHSEKGRRNLRRPGRVRGPVGRFQFRGRSVRVIVACAQVQVVTSLVFAERVRLSDIWDALADRITGTPHIIAREGRVGPAAAFARLMRGSYRQSPRHPGSMGRPAMVTAYARKLEGWLGRFRGVATRYLPHYLIWHRLLDAGGPRAVRDLVLRWPLAAA